MYKLLCIECEVLTIKLTDKTSENPLGIIYVYIFVHIYVYDERLRSSRLREDRRGQIPPFPRSRWTKPPDKTLATSI